MGTNLPEAGTERSPSRSLLSPADAVILVIGLGLAAGYLDLVLMLLKKYYLSELRHFRSARDFPWTVPAGHVVLLVVPGTVLAAVSWMRLGRVTLRGGTWLLATLAIWGALLRAPLYASCSLLLAAGLGRLVSGAVAAHGFWRHARYAAAGLLGLLGVLAALTSGRQAVREYLAVDGLPAPPTGARNVVLIVWDTVRSHNLSLYGYPRNTSPNLARWARKGVRYDLAVAPAPWTYPSQSCFFTGQWPRKLDSLWNDVLDAPDPTLAEYLARRGYQTAGLSANTGYCTYETGLDRGFIHFEDFPLTPLSFLGRTVPGKWGIENIVRRGDFYDRKWIQNESRDARGLNDAFRDWLRRRRRDRPFFAFLNYYDAHNPYVPPARRANHFGIQPNAPGDYQFLFDYLETSMVSIRQRDLAMARDCYDDCIAFLDAQLGRLLDDLQDQGLLHNTLVIITSDHGEGFGDHRTFGHGESLYLDAIGVPLVILSPGAPAGRVVADPISLRDLPATVVDQLGLSAGSPFPGRSLAAFWPLAPGQPPPEVTPALSEQSGSVASRPHESGPSPGYQISLVALGRHYIRNSAGLEYLYDLVTDGTERVNLANSAGGRQVVGVYRKMLLDALTDNPGSIEMENTYLKAYRQRLKSIVEESPLPGGQTAALEKRSNGILEERPLITAPSPRP
jgi:arylsulfatase A-like enzyme